jgi:O-antigen ligase
MGVIRLTGIDQTHGQPNAFAAVTIYSLPVWLFMYRVRRVIAATWPSFWRKWFYRGLQFYPLLAGTTIVFTRSRAGLAGGAVFVVLVALRGRDLGRKIGYLLAAVMLLVCVWFALPHQSKVRLVRVRTAGWDESAMGRVYGFRAGLEMFRRHPLTGVGIANFGTYRARHLDGDSHDAHNLLGQTLGETGIVGAGAFLLLIGCTVANCRRIRRLGKHSTDVTTSVLSEFARATLQALVLLVFMGSFGHNIYEFNWLWLAAFASLAARFALSIRREEALAFAPLPWEQGALPLRGSS